MPEKQNRSTHKVVYLRLTPEEAEILAQKAAELGLTESAYLRLVIRLTQAVHIEAESRARKE